MFKFTDISKYLGYTVATISFIFGIVLVSGLAFEYVPSKLRITFGVVMILWGIYRFVNTRIQAGQRQKEEEEE